eukprot:CAMPEP_0179099220 /NCGR_PEP_ID=MMETSP0796-20121207/45765_1 /TAXON_ID=73915 /ORGANISM="Pyrodinium bahamense, Strain pbaha01" /LENGTH=59 /DNA_ID=CAMNT_0020797019 /DNA_START=131 /DNA_END=311 /DNA_ORIENTATION=-
MKAGDWICPNPECKDMVFAKNDRAGSAAPRDQARTRTPPTRTAGAPGVRAAAEDILKLS